LTMHARLSLLLLFLLAGITQGLSENDSVDTAADVAPVAPPSDVRHDIVAAKDSPVSSQLVSAPLDLLGEDSLQEDDTKGRMATKDDKKKKAAKTKAASGAAEVTRVFACPDGFTDVTKGVDKAHFVEILSNANARLFVETRGNKLERHAITFTFILCSTPSCSPSLVASHTPPS
jgi:hypothetical protein